MDNVCSSDNAVLAACGPGGKSELHVLLLPTRTGGIDIYLVWRQVEVEMRAGQRPHLANNHLFRCEEEIRRPGNATLVVWVVTMAG